MIYRFDRSGRAPKALGALLVSWAVIFGLWAVFDMALWITLVFLACTLPALWDVIRDTRSFVEVHQGRIVWSSPIGHGDVSDVDHVRLNRRFDGTFKVMLVHVGGATTRLPATIAPPADAFEAALRTANIATQRHPFALF